VKRALLSELLTALQCPAAKLERPDEIFDLGCLMIGMTTPAKNAEVEADNHRQVETIFSRREFLRPHLGISWRHSKGITNDLYVPGSLMGDDGVLHIHFPVPVSTPLSSSVLDQDWRFIGLVDWVPELSLNKEPTKIILTAFDASGRRVAAVMDLKTLEAYRRIEIENLGKQARPGIYCKHCGLNASCQALENALEIVDFLGKKTATRNMSRETRTQQLFYQRMHLQTMMENLEARKKSIDKELVALSVDGYLKFGPQESFVLPAREVKHWDINKVMAILKRNELWDNSFAAVDAKRLGDAMESFPIDVRKQLEEAYVSETREPSIAEAANHARIEPKATLFKGLAGKSRRVV
jgi:hypothetical protein